MHDNEKNYFEDVLSVTTKDDVVDTAVLVRNYETKEKAKSMYEVYLLAPDSKGKVTLDGKDVIFNDYHVLLGDKDIKKDELIKIMKGKGYVCK